MSDPEVCLRSLSEQAELIRSKRLSPRELVASTLRQIERVDPQVNGYITLLAERATTEAADAEQEISRGNYRGPLHGIPIALKDLFHVAGVPTTAGSPALKDFVPAADATVVTRLRDSGAVILGKTNMHEFAYGTTNVNPHFGDVCNPWDLERMSGGSSGGSAAVVATGMASAALGSDSGGSIRIPASLCGVFGLKPTYGRVSRHGVIPLAWSADHVGPLARSACDAAIVLRAIAGRDPQDPASSPKPVPDYVGELRQEVSGLRVAVLREYAAGPMAPGVLAAFQEALQALASLGMRVEDVSMPEVRNAISASTAILSAEASACHEERLRDHPDDYGEDVRARLELGLLLCATDYVKAQRVRRLVSDRFRELFRRYDAVVCPTEPMTAPRRDQDTVEYGGEAIPTGTALVRYTRLHNLTGIPVASVQCGFDSNALPIGFQVAAGPFQEAVVLRIAHAYQQITDWHTRVPPVAVVK